jgi:hypothetical protein
MARLLSGVTHAIVIVPTSADARANNTFAIVDLCFGPGDDTCIAGIRYTRDAAGQTMWQVPMVEVVRHGRRTSLPVLKGKLLVEATKLASTAVARIKKDLGGSGWGKRYQVYKDQILVEDLPKE